MYSDKKILNVAEAVRKIMEADKMAKKDHDQDGKIETGKAEYLGSRIRAAKMAGKLKEEDQLEEGGMPSSVIKHKQRLAAKTPEELHAGFKEVADRMGKSVEHVARSLAWSHGYGKGQGQGSSHYYDKVKHLEPKSESVELDEAFPTVADGEKALRAKEGKTSKGTLIKTKMGVRHERDYDDEKEPEVKRGRGRPKKRLSEMRQEYLQFMEEVDNETFTKELKDQKAKFDGKKKGADVAKPAVQAVKVEEYEADDGALSEEQLEELSRGTLGSYVKKANAATAETGINLGYKAGRREGGSENVIKLKNRTTGVARAADKLAKEEVEQIDEISKELAGKYLTAPQGKGANKYKVGADKSVYPNYDAMSKHDKSVGRALKRSGGSALNKKPSYYKEDVQMDEVAPPGREDQVKALKKVPGIDNPYAVSWASYRKSHPKKSKE